MAMKKKNINKFYVINWDMNKKCVEYYDILPYLRNCIKEQKEIFKKYKRTKAYKNAIEGLIPFNEYRNFPSNEAELKEFIDRKARYMWWSRCQYEVIVSDWPCEKYKEKIDIYDQFAKNIDLITKILSEEFYIINKK